MEDVIHSIREAITLPWWAIVLALVFCLVSPLMIRQWRRNPEHWHKS
ncbi:hypothetical protein ACVWZ6_005578 [Bradyrhizobium sp. GM6.1]